ncbi:hypothetical protein [Edaphobacter aggregans]|uniref:hypothetical protein n=1 Tax=Edaphobacter aggregans TaxID=570835 RepID=UPI0012F8DBF0|nr:hypothetical protein [Edaphobacter aggregans]
MPTQTQPTGAVPAKGDQASLANGTELQVKERVFVFDYKMDIKHPSSLRLAHPDVCEYIDLGASDMTPCPFCLQIRDARKDVSEM